MSSVRAGIAVIADIAVISAGIKGRAISRQLSKFISN